MSVDFILAKIVFKEAVAHLHLVSCIFPSSNPIHIHSHVISSWIKRLKDSKQVKKYRKIASGNISPTTQYQQNV